MIPPKVTFDTKGFEAGIQRFARDLNKDIRVALIEQAKLFLRDLIAVTPPHGQNAFTEGTKTQQNIGRKAVARDVNRVFLAAQDIRSNTEEGSRLTKYLRRYAREGRIGAAKKLLEVMGFDNEVTTVARPHIHIKKRGNRGRVSAKVKKTIVLSKKSIVDYTKEVQKRVGRAKAGWVKAARALGVPIPSWVGRHTTPGMVDLNKLHHFVKPEITIGNLIEFADDFDERKFAAAIDNRVQAIPKRIAYLMRDRVKKEGGKVSGGA